MSWAQQAGFTDITPSASAWCYATPEDRSWWGSLWADRIRQSSMAEQALASGAATPDDLQRIAQGWLRWAQSPDGWLAIPHGEVLARP